MATNNLPDPIVTNPINNLIVNIDAPDTTLNLSNYFDDPLTTGKVAHFNLANTSAGTIGDGTINVVLFDQSGIGAPLTVQNFQSYVNTDSYTDSFIHRSLPGFVVQGGGYTYNSTLGQIPANSPVQNEFSPNRSNLRGTIAMAKLGTDPNSATNQWFFNLADNSTNLDNQNGGFTVFGQAISTNDLTTIDAIAAVPIYSVNTTFTDLPLTQARISDTNFIRFSSITISQEDELKFSIVGNSQPTLVTPKITNQQLALDYLPNQTGNSDITIRATNLFGEFIDSKFTATVLPTISLALSPTSVPEDSPNNLIYTFTRNGDFSTSLTANYSVAGTAIFNTDYTPIGAASFTATTGSITFAANSATATLTIDPTADTTIESDETVNLTLATNASYTIGTTTAVTATITNDDFPVVNINKVPTLNTIANPTAILEDAVTQTINLSGISAGINESQTLTVKATSNNSTLIANPIVNYNSPNSTATLSYTPTANQSGTALITVTVQDNGGTANGGVDTVSQTFTVNVTAVNDLPVLKTPLLDQTAKSNSAFTFTLPRDTFSDPDAVNPYKNLVIFGDSLSDTGNAYKASGNTFPAPPYYQGRLSNGLIWADYFAPDLQFTDQSIQNYAFLGANTGISNTFASITVPGLLTQIQQFKTLNANSIGKDGLYIIWAGANDFLNLTTDPTQAVTNAVTNISSAIATLAGLGAKKIVVGNLTDLGATPASITNNNVANARAISIGFNTALTQALNNLEPALNIDLSLVDIFGLSTAVQANPANYKFTNITQPLITVTNPVDPNQYAFWDDVHPTTRLHQLVTDTFENTLLNENIIPDLVKYSATLENGNALPNWLTFNPTTRTFSGTPTNDNVENLNIKAIATDKAGATASDIFVVAVEKFIDTKPPVVGTPGDDKLIATPGSPFDGQNNIVFTGAGKDEVDLSTVSVLPNSGNNTVDLGTGDDIIYVNKGDSEALRRNRVFGSDGNDTFYAKDGQGGNRMSGGLGDDTFWLGSDDRALGGDGNDIFRVGLGGGNLISGGAGTDQFWIVNAELPKAANTILDFQLGLDVIGINGAVSLGITTSTLKLNQVGADTVISFQNQTLATLTGIQANSLSLTNTNQFIFA
jgi:phospholipase/lecithinase/hemolysin/cyclophilin family peptidyl-prolyl cis-trans isomerase